MGGRQSDMTARAQLHRLVDALPEDALHSAGHMLAALSASPLADSVTAALAKAPMDDEPVTPAYAEAVAEGERDVNEGRVVSAAELRLRLDAADAVSGIQREAERRGFCRLTAAEVEDEIQAARKGAGVAKERCPLKDV